MLSIKNICYIFLIALCFTVVTAQECPFYPFHGNPATLDDPNSNPMVPWIQNFGRRYGESGTVTGTVYLIGCASKLWYDVYAATTDNMQYVHLPANFPRLPAAQRTLHNRNVAVLLAGARFSVYVYPDLNEHSKEYFTELGIDWEDRNENPDNPIGLANLATKTLIDIFGNDGMNLKGNTPSELENGFWVPGQRLFDYTDYVPVNTAFELKKYNRWQPNLDWDNRNFRQLEQRALMQQTGRYNLQLSPLNKWSVLPPLQPNFVKFKKNGDNSKFLTSLRAVSDAMGTHDQYTLAEFDCWENKQQCPVFFHGWYIANYVPGGDTTKARVLTGLAQNGGLLDALAVLFHYKREFDYWRPWTGFREALPDEMVNSYSGDPAHPIVQVPGRNFQSFRRTMEHQDNPSGSSGLCQTIYGIVKEVFTELNGGVFNSTFKVPFEVVYGPQFRPEFRAELGANQVWPTITLRYHTLEEVRDRCAFSRQRGGVHYPEATTIFKEMVELVGKNAYHRAKELAGGTLW